MKSFLVWFWFHYDTQVKAAWWSMSLIVMLETCNYVTKCFFFVMNNLTFQGFPVGTKVDEQDPACVPNAKYTLGEFSVSGV